MVSISVWTSYACTNQIPGSQENKKMEPVSSTSRRGARAAYHDEYPRDFDPRIAYTVELKGRLHDREKMIRIRQKTGTVPTVFAKKQ